MTPINHDWHRQGGDQRALYPKDHSPSCSNPRFHPALQACQHPTYHAHTNHRKTERRRA